MKNVVCTCAHCGETVLKTAYTVRISKTGLMFCNMACKSAFGRVEATCPACDTKFTIKRANVGRCVYCSPACLKLYRRSKVEQSIESRYSKSVGEILHDLYNVQSLGRPKVCEVLGINDRTLTSMMGNHGIAQRSRTDAVKLQWADNEDRRTRIRETHQAWCKQNPEKVQQRSIAGNLALQTLNGPTSIERVMMQALEQAGIKFEFQYSVGNKFLCDFYLPSSNLIIECDGEYWHGTDKQKSRDKSKDAYLTACGFRVQRFTGTAIMDDVQGCLQTALTQ